MHGTCMKHSGSTLEDPVQARGMTPIPFLGLSHPRTMEGEADARPVRQDWNGAG